MRFCLSNSLGSTVGLIDTTGTVTDSYSYDPYGARTVVTGQPYAYSAIPPGCARLASSRCPFAGRETLGFTHCRPLARHVPLGYNERTYS